jgi:hypothetical protein
MMVFTGPILVSVARCIQVVAAALTRIILGSFTDSGNFRVSACPCARRGSSALQPWATLQPHPSDSIAKLSRVRSRAVRVGRIVGQARAWSAALLPWMVSKQGQPRRACSDPVIISGIFRVVCAETVRKCQSTL